MQDFTLDFPPALTARIRSMHRDVHQLHNYTQILHKLHQETRIQSKQTLVELCRSKADAQFAQGIRQQVEKFKVSMELEIKEYEAFCRDNFADLKRIAGEEIVLLDQLESVRGVLRDVKSTDLLPCVTYAVTLGRKLQQHQDQAKAISLDVQKMMRTFQNAVSSRQKQFGQIKEQIEMSSFEISRLTDEYTQKMSQRIAPEVQAFQQTLQNIDLCRYEKDRIMLQISDQTMAICGEIIQSCRETADNEVNLRSAINEYLPCVQDTVNAEQELREWLAQRREYYIAEVDARIRSFTLSLSGFFAQGCANVAETLRHCQKQLDEHFGEDKYLTQLGHQITEVQNQWQSDIQNFKLIYIDGALESVKNKLVSTFEIKLTEDAANVLQHAQHFLAELVQMVQTWNQVQAERRLRQTEQIQQMDAFLRVLHAKVSDMKTERIGQLANVGRAISDQLNAKFTAMSKLLTGAEFRKQLATKLDKARCDAAFTVVCPAERYAENEFIDMNNLPKARLASEPLNAPLNAPLSALPNRAGSGAPRTLSVHKVPPPVVQSDPFCKTEPLMSTLAFGQARYNDSVRRMMQREEPQKMQLQRVPQVLERETTAIYDGEPIQSLELSTTATAEHFDDQVQSPTRHNQTAERGPSSLATGESQTLVRANSLPSGHQKHYVRIVSRQFPNRASPPRKRRQFRRFKAVDVAVEPGQSKSAPREGMHPYDPPLNRWGNRGLWKLGQRAEIDLSAYIAEYERQFK